MPKSISVGYTDTPISGVPSLTFTRGLVNYGADFRIKADTPSELILVNLTSPVDRPEKFRVAYSEVSDIYKGTDIDPSVYAASRRGVSVLVQLTEILSETDTADPSYRVDAPLSMHLVIKIPAADMVTDTMIQTALGRLISGVYDTGALTTTRIKSLVRGSLKPADL